MSGAVSAFLDSLVDYAGLFPPASLSVADAVAEYAVHRGEAEAWMLGRFIAPAGRLTEIAAAAREPSATGRAWPFSILVGAGTSPDKALAVLAVQAEQVRAFEADLAGQVRVESLEAPLPLVAEPALMAAFVSEFLKSVRTEGLGQREIFLELPAGCDDQAILAAIAEVAPDHTAAEGGFTLVGAKLRCGGVTADAFPACERIAGVIHAAAKLGVSLKCTAGLHHPVRHRASEPDVMMHGFLNVFGAGILAHAVGLGPADLVACVAETDARAFVLNSGGFSWRDHHVKPADVREIRDRFLCGFGSCSFAEPRADLQDLGVL